MISLNDLNPAQRAAASTVEGPVLILAGAGSGKTRTITYRIAHMLDTLRIPGNQILAVSFTNKASTEMRERVFKLVPHQRKSGVTLSTFHSLGIKILREDIKHLGFSPRFTIYDSSDQMSIIREGLKNYKGGKSFDKATIQSKISWLKNQGISPSGFKDSKFFDYNNEYDVATEVIYHFYQEKLQFFNALDFDDILYLIVQLFDKHPEIAEKYSKRFQYIMIDEYQDTNSLQFKLVKALTSTHQNICVVGDDDQSIYAFRGADLSNILEFEKTFSGAKVVKLEENYRSYFPILNLANLIIKENKIRKDKTMKTNRVGGDKPQLWTTGDTEHEAQVIIEDILVEQKKGVPLSEMCLLYRSNTQVPPFEDQLRIAQIPYAIIGGQKFYEKKEIKDLIAYLMVIMNPRDEISLRRILNVPNRGIGSVTLNKYLSKSYELKKSLFEVIDQDAIGSKNAELFSFTNIIKDVRSTIKDNGLVKGLEHLISSTHYLDFVDKSYDNPKISFLKKSDVTSFISAAERFMNRFAAEATLENFVEKLLLADSQDTKEEDHNQAKKNEITLMTLHSSKGLEFDHVYLVGMEEELLPHKRTITEDADMSEERRLCYVGVTRARKKLVMTYAKQRKIYGKDIARFPSRFVIPHAEAYTTKDRTTFNDLTPEETQKFKTDFFAGLMKSLE